MVGGGLVCKGFAVKDIPHQNGAGEAGRKRRGEEGNGKLVPQTLTP